MRSRPRRGAVLPALPLIAALCACGGGPEAPAFAVRDSAGIRIAESRAPAWSPGGEWTLAAEPHLDIGGRPGEPGHDLHRVATAVRLEDGRVLVANTGSGEIRIFDADGTLLLTLGREGEGPGEFRALSRLYMLPGDSLLATDVSLDRLTVFDAQGAVARTAPLEHVPGEGAYFVVGRLADGTLLARNTFSFSGGSPTGVYEQTLRIARYAPDGSIADSLGSFPGSEYYVYSGGGITVGGNRIWGRNAHVAAAADGFAFGSGARFEIELRDASGALRGLVRAALPPRRVTDRDVARLRESVPDDDPSAELSRRILDAIEPPSHFPAYDALLFDAQGNLWVREYEPWPDERPTVRWHVFDPDGRWLGGVAAPHALRIVQIGEDEVLGVFSDSLDVEHVRAYRLDRGGGG